MILRWAPVRSRGRVGRAPTREHLDDAGWDLYSAENKVLAVGETYRFGTGIAVWFERSSDVAFFEASWYGRLADKSGLAAKKHVTVLGGVVDKGYRGEVQVVLANLGPHAFMVEVGDVLCQIVPTLILMVEGAERGVIEETERGERGFSSGT